MRALFLLLILAYVSSSTKSRSIFPHPKPLSSIKIHTTQNGGTCYFAYTVKTSCSSPRFTRDHVSITFGDANGNKIYDPKLEDPDFRTLGRCATDTFDLYGPCTNQICYMYLYRTGNDGWIPSNVTVYAYNTKPVTFYFNVNIPKGVQYGFNYCSKNHG
ncbi:hypothetical protein ACS0TY_029131 [Phlomoides rotata]